MRPATLRAAALSGLVALSFSTFASEEKFCPPGLEAEKPMVPHSLEQADIDSGALSFNEIRKHGELLFSTQFNVCDGRGRPFTTGGGGFRDPDSQFAPNGPLETEGQLAKLRTSGPDSSSCTACHGIPGIGGAGDFVSNVFVLAELADPVTLSIGPDFGNSRNPMPLHGAGPIEMLAREMTADLQAQANGLGDGVHTLITKGISFEIEILNGAIIETEGIDHDLIVKPFHQAGKVVSLRQFSDNAMNQHFGMQAEERFDLNPAKVFDLDHDGDGVERELTIGDITAISIWQAQLPTPTQVLPQTQAGKRRIARGEQLFDEIGCTSCHVSELVLNSRHFVEPNPFNPPGTCATAAEGCSDFSFNMTKEGGTPRLEKGPGGTAIVRAFTDLKRHNLCDDEGPDAIRYFCNEKLAQGRPDQGGKPGAEFFLTRRLWDVGSTAPYGHRGDISTITEAILLHGGEGRASRDAFVASPIKRQKKIVRFLKSLQIVN